MCPGTANKIKANIIAVCSRCYSEIEENDQGYYYAKTNGFCMWCANIVPRYSFEGEK